MILSVVAVDGDAAHSLPCVSAQEMSEDPCTPKEEKQERLSRHKETMQRSQAEEEAHLLAQQRLVYDRSCRALKRRSVIRRHEMEQEQLREVRASRQNPKPSSPNSPPKKSYCELHI